MKRSLLLLIVFLIVSISSVLAQSRKVTGRILDESGQGLPGASVSVPSTTLGTVTDIDGNFSLDVPNENTVLLIRSITYNEQQVNIPASNTVSVNMTLASKELQTVVVSALALRREKREIGYSATTVSDQELNAANTVSPLSALQGKVAGANITSSTGGPGGSTRVVLRGEKSLNGNNNALIVVDGIPINNSSRLSGVSSLEQIDFGNMGNDVNPDDIESVTVLKGPAAAALYGSQAANGAIMITTKSGKTKAQGGKRTQISYSTNYTLTSILKYPEMQHKYGQGDLQGIPNDRRENFSWGLPFDGQMRPWGQVINGQQLVKPYEDQPDNIKRFFRTGTAWENAVSLGGGSEENAFYYLSLNTLNSKQVVPNTFYDKYSVRFNGSTKLGNNFYSSVNVNYINVRSRVESQGQAGGSVWQNLLQTPRDIPVWELKNYKTNPFYGYGFKDSAGIERFGNYAAYVYNPYWVADNYENRNNTDRVLGNVILGYKPNDKFNIFNRVGGDVVSDVVTSKQPKFLYQPYDPFYNTLSSEGGYYESSSKSGSFYNDLIANYDRDLGKNFTIHGLLGNSLQYNKSTFISGEINPATNGLIIPDYYNLSNGQGPVITTNNKTESFLVGVYGSVRADYKKTLYLEATARNDWSSTLALPGDISGISFFYPSITGSWIFSELFKGKFREDIFNYGKFRMGFAAVGNGAQPYQNNPPGYSRATSATGFGTITFPFNGVPGYSYSNVIADPDLKPERTNSTEAGLELAFLKNRLTIEGTYYYNMSIDNIITLPVAASTGYTGYVTNIGRISNKGFELAVRGTPISSRTGWRWEVYGTFTKNVNTVEELANGVERVTIGGYSGLAITAAVGKPFGGFYATDFERDPQGRVVVDQATGLPKMASNPSYAGSYQPKFIASWGTSLKYKNLSFSILFDTKQGGKFYSQTKQNLDFVGTAPETAENDRQPYVFPNSVYQSADGQYIENTSITFLPYQYYTTTSQNVASIHVLDASYIKLREVSLSYNFPNKWFDKTPLGSGSIGVYGNNLFIWTSKENVYVDPEINSGGATNEQGFDFVSRPSLRNYGINLKFTF